MSGWDASGMGALAAGGEILGKKGRDKEKIKRVEPPALKFANAVRMMEAARGITGKLGFADELEQNRLRSLASQERQRGIQSILRSYGNVEGPGKYEAINNLGTSGMQGIIGAMNQNRMQRHTGSLNIANQLARDNPAYMERKVKEGPTWAKAMGAGIEGASMGMAMGSKPPLTTGVLPPPASVGGGFDNLSGTGKVLPKSITSKRKPFALNTNKRRMGMMGRFNPQFLELAR